LTEGVEAKTCPVGEPVEPGNIKNTSAKFEIPGWFCYTEFINSV
jgi:hypothetical protein